MNNRLFIGIAGGSGSGKTTFIKLLCRLYDPQEGQILLNGMPLEERPSVRERIKSILSKSKDTEPENNMRREVLKSVIDMGKE